MLSCAVKLQDAHVLHSLCRTKWSHLPVRPSSFPGGIAAPCRGCWSKESLWWLYAYPWVLAKKSLGEPVIGKAAPASNSHGWRVRFPGLWTTSSLLLPFLWWAKPHPSSQKSRGPRCWFLELHFFSPKKWWKKTSWHHPKCIEKRWFVACWRIPPVRHRQFARFDDITWRMGVSLAKLQPGVPLLDASNEPSMKDFVAWLPFDLQVL